MQFFKNRNSGAMALILEGVVFMMIFNLYNPFIQMFAKRMGGSDMHIALLNAVPPLVAVFTLVPCGVLIERINKKKQTVMVLLSIVSIFYAAIAFVPAIPHEGKVLAFVILIGLMNWPGALYLTTWQSYFADNFRGSYANRVYTVRSRFSTLFGLITVLVTGILLTSIPKSDAERLFVYQIFYGVCFALTLLQIYLFSRVKNQKRYHSGTIDSKKTVVKPSLLFDRKTFADMFKNRKFIIFCICGLVFHFSWQMAWPLFFIYNTDYALLNELQLGLLNVASGTTTFISLSVWNRLIEKKGSRLALVFGAIGLAMSPMPYTMILSFPVLIMINVISGISLAGFNLSLFLTLLDTLPKEKKTVYISVFNTIISITGFLAPLTGLWIFNRTNIFLTMAITGALRLVGSLLYFIQWRRSKIAMAQEQKSNGAGVK